MNKIFTIIDPNPSVYRAVKIDAVMSVKTRRLFLKTNSLLVLIFGVFSAFAIFESYFFPLEYAANLRAYYDETAGLFLVSASAFLFLLFFEFFYASNLRSSAVLVKDDEKYTITYDAATVMYFGGMLSAPEQIPFSYIYKILTGRIFFELTLLRLGVLPDVFRGFIENAGNGSLSAKDFLHILISLAGERKAKQIGARELVEGLFVADENFQKFFFDQNIKREELAGAADWTDYTLNEARKEYFVWEKSKLARIPGIGKDLSYGYTFELDKFSREITGRNAPRYMGSRKETALAIESILSNSREANVLILADPGEGRHSVIEGLSRMIESGQIAPALEFKRMVELDFSSITASTKTKGNLEAAVIKTMNEAVRAGNIILVIEDLPEVLDGASALGVDFISLIEKYAAGSNIQIIATSDRARFHSQLERMGKISRLFEKIELPEPLPDELIKILEEAADEAQIRSGKLFTYQAILRIADLSDRYIIEGVMPGKAVRLLDEISSSLDFVKINVISASAVDGFVSRERGIPIEKPQKEEKELLLNLEEFMHKRVVGQEEALRVIAEALRRLRSGLTSRKRPIGAFLFLGPTGVGKTETAKALAEVYFGGEEAMRRFDMSEYRGEDASEKLIGSASSATHGVLTERIHERPFSLLLFDEFEKASAGILNLFLQILDEGFYSDPRGNRVSVRETMIIATSNAGANLIWDLVSAGKDPASEKETVINEVRKSGIFSPELLNRFDAVVVYRPLSREDLKKIAALMLGEIARRLKEKDITFEITPELAEKVAQIGYDPVFGARPMRRMISEKIESIIAKKILADELKRGSVFSLSREEIEKF